MSKRWTWHWIKQDEVKASFTKTRTQIMIEKALCMKEWTVF